jgi:hypothetical protein
MWYVVTAGGGTRLSEGGKREDVVLDYILRAFYEEMVKEL